MPELQSLKPESQEWLQEDSEALQALVADYPIIQRWLTTVEASIIQQTMLAPLDFESTTESLGLERAFNCGRIQIMQDLMLAAGIK